MSTMINIALDFSDVPGGRFPADGEFSGETFREKYLVPRLDANEIIDVVLDNTEGMGSSFLEEAFGGLVRVHGYSSDFLKKHLRIIANSSVAGRYKSIAEKFIADALSTRGHSSAGTP